MQVLEKRTEKSKEVGGENSSSLKVLLELEWTGNVHCCTICDITFLVGGP